MQSYSKGVRIHNWFEEGVQDEHERNKIRGKADMRSTELRAFQSKKDHCTQKVPLGYSDDGFLRYGQPIMLFNVKTGGVLSVDLFERTNTRRTCATAPTMTTSSLFKGPIARNVFIIEPASGPGTSTDEPVRMGDHFTLRSTPYLSMNEQLYVHSEPVSHITSAKHERHQEVVCAPIDAGTAPTSDVFWKFEHPNKDVRFEAEGDVVKAGEELLVIHVPTRQALASRDKPLVHNNFGAEYAVSAFTHLKTNRNHTMLQEYAGQATADTAFRGETTENHWIPLLGQDPKMAEDRGVAERVNRGAAILGDLRAKLCASGVRNIVQLDRRFRLIDRDGSGFIEINELVHGLENIGLVVDEMEVRAVMAAMDTNKDGKVSRDEFMNAVRGTMSPDRLALVLRAFAKLDQEGHGEVTLDQLCGKYTPVNRAKSLKGFMEAIGDTNQDGVLTKEEFVNHFTALSASIKDDAFFKDMMLKAWNL